MTNDVIFVFFYIAWALMLQPVGAQWGRVVFMQTNREDLGDRWKEISIPVPSSRAEADSLSGSTRDYYEGLARLKSEHQRSLEEWR